MGAMIDLCVGNLVADWGKNVFYRDHRSLFQELDVRNVVLGEDAGGREGWIKTLSRPLRDVLPRLHLLGYTLESARLQYSALLEADTNEDNPFPSFDTLAAALSAIDVGNVSDDYEDDHSFGEFFREEIGPRINMNALLGSRPADQWAFAEMMENFHPWNVLVLLAEKSENLELPVTWDYFEHSANGWSEESDSLPKLKPEERFLIVTEGSSDSKVIQKALAILKPSIVDFFTFIDMEEGYPFSGSGNLASFCRGLAKISIQNKTLILFDNDAEGVCKQEALASLSTPSTMRILRLPDHPALNSIPCIGTSGETNNNINGRAASIEAYLDLEWRANRSAVVRWTNYVQSLDAYQGALESKEYYVRQFLDLRTPCAGYETTKLEAVLSTLIQNAKSVAEEHPARAEY